MQRDRVRHRTFPPFPGTFPSVPSSICRIFGRGMRAMRSGGEGMGMVIQIGVYLNGEVLSWYGFLSLVTYHRSPVMASTPVAIPV